MTYLLGTPAMLVLDSLFILYTFWALSLGRNTQPAARWLALGMVAWLGVLHLGLSRAALFPGDISGLAFYGVILAGVGAVGVLVLAVPPLRRLLLGLGQGQLMLLQGIRVYFGALFLAQGGAGLLPPEFGLIDGLTHVSAGFFGLVAAFSVAIDSRARRRVWFANLFGLLDILIVATSLAFLLLQDIGPHHPMMYAVFLPAPFWLWIHLVSIGKLIGLCSGAHATEQRT